LIHRRHLLFALGATLAVPAFAARARAVTPLIPRPPTAADRPDLARVETYLNELKTLHARFLQVAENGQSAEGDLYLARPGRLRVEYDPPSPILLITVGDQLVHYDKALKAVTYLPLDSTPAGFLVRERVTLSGDVTVSAIEHGPAVLRVTLTQTKDPRAGKLTLAFSERPFALTSWQVVDAQGVATRVTLVDPRVGLALDPALFRFVDPNLPK
jgi:outer membrane lipoprotein-sorting protein